MSDILRAFIVFYTAEESKMEILYCPHVVPDIKEIPKNNLLCLILCKDCDKGNTPVCLKRAFISDDGLIIL